MGYSLNEQGLSTNVIRDTNDRRRKITAGKRVWLLVIRTYVDVCYAKGTIIASETEEEIFHILGRCFPGLQRGTRN